VQRSLRQTIITISKQHKLNNVVKEGGKKAGKNGKEDRVKRYAKAYASGVGDEFRGEVKGEKKKKGHSQHHGGGREKVGPKGIYLSNNAPVMLKKEKKKGQGLEGCTWKELTEREGIDVGKGGVN